MSCVIDLVRFSCIPDESTDFVRTWNKRMDERQSLVRNPEQLKKRMRLFEAVCPSSLAAQSADRFSGVILTSDKLPEPFADRLRKLLAPYPDIQPAFLSRASVQKAFFSAIAILPTSEAAADDIRITFRLDDDDSVSSDFVDFIERYHKPQYLGFCVSLSKGLGPCRLYGRTGILERRHYMCGSGLAHVGVSNSNKNMVHSRFRCNQLRTTLLPFPTSIRLPPVSAPCDSKGRCVRLFP